MKLPARLQEPTLKTIKVVGWVGASAAITAICTFVLEQPEYAKYYGIVNIIIFFINELRQKRE